MNSPQSPDDRLTAGKFFRYFSAVCRYYWTLHGERAKLKRLELRSDQRDPAFLRANLERYNAGRELRIAWDAACEREAERSARSNEIWQREQREWEALRTQRKAEKAERKAWEKAQRDANRETTEKAPTVNPISLFQDPEPEHDKPLVSAPVKNGTRTPVAKVYVFGASHPIREAPLPDGVGPRAEQVATRQEIKVSAKLAASLEALDRKAASSPGRSEWIL